MDEHGAFVRTMIDLNLAPRGGPFGQSQIAFFNVKCSRKRVNLGNPCLCTILVQRLLRYCSSAAVRWHSLLFLPFLFHVFWMLFGLPSIFCCRNTYIEYG